MGAYLSVVTVCLNAARTIEATLASVSQQITGFEFEHICVDGGSTDGTRDIIDRWAARDARLQRLYEPDQGIFDAMNKGLRLATGDYVLFLNADDFLADSNALSLALHEYRPDHPGNPDLIAGDAAMGTPRRFGFWRHRRVPRSLMRFRGCGLYPVHQALIARRLLLAAAGGFDARLRLAADTTLFYDVERNFAPQIRVLQASITVMRPGGAANAGMRALVRGSMEIFRHLSPEIGATRAACMLLMKTLQSLGEMRFGRCPHEFWFSVEV